MKFHYSNIPLFPMKEIIGETREMNRPKLAQFVKKLLIILNHTIVESEYF